MPKIVLFISLDVLKYKVEKTLNQFGIVDVQIVGTKMLTIASKNFIYSDVQLIIIDSDSLDFDAFTILSNLRKGAKSAHLPILVLGNRTEKSYISRLMALGCTDYISKPLDDMTLASKVIQMMRESERPNSNEIIHKSEPLEDVKLKWNDAFKTGIDDIDNDHQKIIENYEKLYQLMKTGQGHAFYDELLIFLSEYIDSHFENEEQFQREIGYDLYDDHKKKHDFFKEKIMTFINKKQDSVSNSDLIKLNLFVKEWLIQHIYIEDMKIGAFYRKM